MFVIILVGILFFTSSIRSFSYHDSIKGLWEGLFMQQFKMEFVFSTSEEGILSGKIKMYNGSTIIQDDPISNIQYLKDTLSFMIPVKETTFEGKLDSAISELNGEFIFPDGSRHPVQVTKKISSSLAKNSLPNTDKNILEKRYSPDQLKEDMQFLRQHLINHPQYHLFTAEDAFNALYLAADQNLNADLTLLDFYNLISPIVGKIGCSHTGIRLPENYMNAQRANNHYFPLRLFLKNDKAWVLGSFDDQVNIRAGSEIVRINNVPVKNIMARLLSFIPAEGYNKTTKYFELNKDFGSYLNLLNNSEQFQIEYIKPGAQEIQSTSIEAVSYALLSSGKMMDMPPSPTLLPLIQKQSTAILEIPSFAMQDVNKYLHLMDSIFELINTSGIRNLVLDLRGNDGGHPIFAAILYAHLSSEEFTYFQENEQVPEFKPLYNPMEPEEHNFTGKCFTIVDGGCLSTTGHLISLLRYNNRAVFIGEEPGSWFYCNDNSKQYSLPNTRIEINIPQTTFMTAVKGYEMGSPFIVDYPLYVSLEDLKCKSDPWIEYTLSLIRASNRSL